MKIQPPTDIFLSRLQAQLSAALASQSWPDNAELYTFSLDVPLPLAFSLFDTDEVFFYTAQPERNRFRLGLGCAYSCETEQANDGQRFTDLQQAFSDLQSAWIVHALDNAAPPPQPAAFIGFAFAADEAASTPWQGWPNLTECAECAAATGWRGHQSASECNSGLPA